MENKDDARTAAGGAPVEAVVMQIELIKIAKELQKKYGNRCCLMISVHDGDIAGPVYFQFRLSNKDGGRVNSVERIVTWYELLQPGGDNVFKELTTAYDDSFA